MRTIIISLFVLINLLQTKYGYSISNEVKEMAIKKGEEASQSLIQKLQSELKNAINQGGYEKAIEICSKKAREIYLTVAKEVNAFEVKRISDRFRNPYSKPDELDAATLREFYNSSITENETPKYFLKERKKEIIYYKPIYISEMCLKCHGGKDEIDTKALEKIQKLYPNDGARGYKIGEFRGFIKVTFLIDSLKKN